MSVQHEREAPSVRGVTAIPPHVVADIAAQAASEVARIGSNAGGVLGVGARRSFGSRPSARCEIYGETAVVHLDLGVEFPASLEETLSAVHRHVGRRVEELTGFTVGRLDVVISWLRPTGRVREALR